jgi:hypothetical protein
MAEYTLHCFAQSGNACKPALMLDLSGADWSARIAALPGWQHPYQLMPGHPQPGWGTGESQ